MPQVVSDNVIESKLFKSFFWNNIHLRITNFRKLKADPDLVKLQLDLISLRPNSQTLQ